jgi:folate-dependent tRNA-U54 methylase TrmFO/GidA
MNVNFGLFPPIDETNLVQPGRKKVESRDRKKALSTRALNDFDGWLRGWKQAA